MKDHNFTIAFTVNQTPEAAFAAINNVRGWCHQERSRVYREFRLPL